MENKIKKNIRKILFKLKGHSLWHMRHYSSKFNIDWGIKTNSNEELYDKVKFNDGKIAYFKNIKNFLKNHEEISILASGPSINQIDLNQFKHQSIALLNGSLRLLDKIPESNKVYHFVSDPNFIQTNSTLYDLENKNNIVFIYSVRAVYELYEYNPKFILDRIDNFYIFDQIEEPFQKSKKNIEELDKLKSKSFYFDRQKNLGFSIEPNLGFFNGRTILFIALQIFTFLEFKSFHLYGVDMGGDIRFYDHNEKNRAPSYLDKDFEKVILPSLIIFADYCLKNNINIINYSENSRIPDSVIKKL